MAGLTVTEKEHWKDRIARRIDRRIDALWGEDPNLEERIEHDARQQALDSMGLADLQAELDEIDRQAETNAERKQQIGKHMLAIVRRVPVEQVRDYLAYQHVPEVDRAIERRQAIYTDQLLARTPLGERIKRLRLEKENLLDTVWLATSSASIKSLWEKVGALLGDPATPLERDALAIPPDTAA
jgi:hypothetical protein